MRERSAQSAERRRRSPPAGRGTHQRAQRAAAAGLQRQPQRVTPPRRHPASLGPEGGLAAALGCRGRRALRCEARVTEMRLARLLLASSCQGAGRAG